MENTTLGFLNRSTDKNKITSILKRDGRAAASAGLRLSPAQPFRTGLEELSQSGTSPLRNSKIKWDCLVLGSDTAMCFGYLERQRGVNTRLFMSSLDRTSGTEVQYGKGDFGQRVAQEDCKIFVTEGF